MLNIKTGKDINEIRKINDIESRFRVLLSNGEAFDKDVYNKIMAQIDGVTERRDTVIKTRFGITTLDNLSTGCKTVMLAIYYVGTDIFVRIDECGENALKVLYLLSDKLNINAFATIPIPIYEENLNCVINGEACKGGYNIYRKLVNLNGNN